MSLALQTGANSAVFDHERDRLAVRPRHDLESDGSFATWGMDTDWGQTAFFRNISRRRRAQTRWLEDRSKRRARRRQDLAFSETSVGSEVVLEDGAESTKSEKRSWSFSGDWGVNNSDSSARRTVTITGRPDPVPSVYCSQRARDRRSVSIQDRLASRPDRVAGWAFGLGLLLILISVSTAHAA